MFIKDIYSAREILRAGILPEDIIFRNAAFRPEMNGEQVPHDVWVAIDPGSIVNPAVIVNQVQSAVALGLSSSLLEEVVYEKGAPQARNFDTYPILNR